MEKVIGRVAEREILRQKLTSGRPELIAVYGRRRVGKTFLIRTSLRDQLIFEMTGMHGASLNDQLKNFALALGKAIKSPAPLALPDSWLDAFDFLDRYLLDNLDPRSPAVIFFDEFPWIHSRKSNFLRAFDHWWNSSGTTRPNLKVVICGSAASWIIEKVLNDRGGLHNRVTQRIRLLPFTLGETAAYLKYLGAQLDHYQILQLYMALGGVPFYLQHVQPGESAGQVIDKLCFNTNGILRTEFRNLFQSLFANSENHEKIVRVLAQNGGGLDRKEIIEQCGLADGGGTSGILGELEESGFISGHMPFGKRANDVIYRLSDEYSLFYQKFVEGSKASGDGTWLKKMNTPSFVAWSGFAFESICFKHLRQIQKALGIEGVLTEVSTWRFLPKKENDEQGAQIDVLLDRQDQCINLCEMKFSKEEFLIDKKYAIQLDNKVNVFRSQTNTRKTIFLTMITTFGVQKNQYYTGRVVKEIVMDNLFK